jgi:methyl-CpG-binding domain protein 4
MIAKDDSKTKIVTAKVRKAPQPRKHVSEHFKDVRTERLSTPPATPATPANFRVKARTKIGDFFSDSELSDVPEDIGPDPFTSPLPSPTPRRVKAVKIKKEPKHPTKSPYFAHKRRPQFLSCLPFPPLSHVTFGLMQERLAHDPYRLLVATIFLNKTRGEQAMPVFYQLMERYPTIAEMASADVEDVTDIIKRLGFQNQRARKIVHMSRTWLESPPELGKRMRKQHYPKKGDGKDVKAVEIIGDEDERVAWEISHLPGLGPYSHDSWRMFCRDELRGVASDWLGAGSGEDFEPEWKRVLPADKELRAWCTWMWLKEGYSWNKETGDTMKADPELLNMARGGGIVKEEADSDHLVVNAGYGISPGNAVARPAGDFMLGSEVRP